MSGIFQTTHVGKYRITLFNHVQSRSILILFFVWLWETPSCETPADQPPWAPWPPRSLSRWSWRIAMSLIQVLQTQWMVKGISCDVFLLRKVTELPFEDQFKSNGPHTNSGYSSCSHLSRSRWSRQVNMWFFKRIWVFDSHDKNSELPGTGIQVDSSSELCCRRVPMRQHGKHHGSVSIFLMISWPKHAWIILAQHVFAVKSTFSDTLNYHELSWIIMNHHELSVSIFKIPLRLLPSFAGSKISKGPLNHSADVMCRFCLETS